MAESRSSTSAPQQKSWGRSNPRLYFDSPHIGQAAQNTRRIDQVSTDRQAGWDRQRMLFGGGQARRRTLNNRERSHQSGPSVSTNTIKVTAGSEPTCSICLVDMQENVLVRKLSCNHIFHSNCVDQWLEQSERSTCPHCRQAVHRSRPGDLNQTYGLLRIVQE